MEKTRRKHPPNLDLEQFPHEVLMIIVESMDVSTFLSFARTSSKFYFNLDYWKLWILSRKQNVGVDFLKIVEDQINVEFKKQKNNPIFWRSLIMSIQLSDDVYERRLFVRLKTLNHLKNTNNFFSPYVYIVGNEKVGKSYLAIKVKTHIKDIKGIGDEDPIIEDLYRMDRTVGGKVMLVEMADCASYMKGQVPPPPHPDWVACVCFSYIDRESFLSVPEWCKRIESLIGSGPVMLVGTKCDINKEKWEVSEEEITLMCRLMKMAFISTSAFTGSGILLPKTGIYSVEPGMFLDKAIHYLRSYRYKKQFGEGDKNLVSKRQKCMIQ